MRKLKLLFAAAALLLGSMTANANVTLETDMTSSFESLATDIDNLKATANSLLGNDAYTNVIGQERTDLEAAVAATPASETQEAYQAVISALNTAISNFENCDVAAYNALAAEKVKAIALGLDEQVVNGSTYVPTNSTDAKSKLQALMVAEYNYVSTNYPYRAKLDTWTTVNNGADREGQHWDNTSDSKYSEQGNGYEQTSWDCSFSQNLTLPKGKFVLKVAGRKSSDSAVLKLTVKNGSTTIGTINDFPSCGGTGRGINTSGETDFSDGGTYAYKGAGRGWQWRYVAFELSGPSTVKISVTASATARNQWISFCNATIQSDIEDISWAIANETNAAWTTLKAYANDLVAVANDNAEANSTLAGAISTQSTAVSDATTAGAIATATSTLKEAMVTYVGAANPVGEGAKFDITFMLTNPDLTPFANETKPAGWYCDNSDGKPFNFFVNRNAKTADGTKDATFEFWSNTPKSGNTFLVYQKMTLPEGTYSMTSYAFAQCADNSSTRGETPSPTGISFSANDIDGSFIASKNLIEAGIEFVQASEGEVKIGLKAHDGNNLTWMGIGYVQLFKVQKKAFTISESAEYDTTQKGAGDVTLNRTIKADNTWNTIWLPFSMTKAELQATFGNDVEIAQFSETVNTNVSSIINFNTMDTPAISPNVPVLLRTSTAGTSYNIAGRTVVDGTPIIEGTNFDFVGTTVANTIIEDGDYFISNNKLYTSTGKSKVKGTRAYLKTTTAGARIISFSLDGEEIAAIEDIERGTITTGKVYNLNGQQLKKAQKGIYIQNGKKVVIK